MHLISHILYFSLNWTKYFYTNFNWIIIISKAQIKIDQIRSNPTNLIWFDMIWSKLIVGLCGFSNLGIDFVGFSLSQNLTHKIKKLIHIGYHFNCISFLLINCLILHCYDMKKRNKPLFSLQDSLIWYYTIWMKVGSYWIYLIKYRRRNQNMNNSEVQLKK